MPVVQCILYSMAYWQRQWQWLIAWSKSDSWVGTRGFLEKSLRDQRIGLLIGLKIPLTSDVRVWGNSSRLTGWTLYLFGRTSLTNVLDHWENCSKELLSSLNLIALVGHSPFPTLIEATCRLQSCQLNISFLVEVSGNVGLSLLIITIYTYFELR